jgi:hypothetical protein
MTGPYLHHGESIILTTDRVSLDTILYDAMLTTERLILIDSRYSRFEPVTIPLSAIISVRRGKAATGEPVIILSLSEPGSPDTRTKNILFSQQPMENRTPDRDQWVKKFIELAVSDREAHRSEPLPATEQKNRLIPSIRRWVAPERIRPHARPVQPRNETAGVQISPEEPEQPEAADAKQVDEPESAMVRDTEGPDNGLPRVEIPPAIMAEGETTGPLPTRDLTPVRAEAVQQPQDSLAQSILVALESFKASSDQEEIPQSGRSPDTPIRLTSPLSEMIRPVSVHDDNKENPTMDSPDVPVSGNLTPAGNDDPANPVRTTSVLPEIPHHTEVPETAVEPLPEDAGRETGETEISPVIVVPPVAEPLQETLPVSTGNDDFRQPRDEPSGLSHSPDKNAPSPVSGAHPLLIGSGIVLCLILVITGILFLPGLLPQNHGPDTVPTTVLTPVPEVNVTRLSTIPQEGVWIRIVSSGYFTGQVGNPGFLKQISGSGERFFTVVRNDDLVKVSVEKQENSGSELLVEIYKDGTMISSRSVNAPMGAVDLLIDPATGKAPGITTTTPITGNKTISNRGQIGYY